MGGTVKFLLFLVILLIDTPLLRAAAGDSAVIPAVPASRGGLTIDGALDA